MLRGRAAAIVVLAAVLAAGCAVPRWVPFIGKTTPKTPAPPAREAATPDRGAAPPKRSVPVLSEDVVDRVVAVVNNEAITLGELLESIAVWRQENREATTPDEELARQFLTRLIDNRLELQEAEREKITVEDAEVEEELTDRIKRLGGPTREEFEAMLRTQGVALEAVKKRVRESIRLSKVVRRKVGLRVSVTPSEIDRYLDENRQKLETGLSYHVRNILIVPDGTTEAAWNAAREKAEAIRAELVRGADFAELAKQHSGDASARDGGDLGTLKRGELAPDVEAQIISLRPGQISNPYRSSLGYHIFRLEWKDSLEGEGLTRVRQQIQEILYRQKYEARREIWLQEIKRRAIIEVRM